MKNNKLIILTVVMSFIFTQEMEIDGNLKITGNIIYADSTIQNTAFSQEALFPYEIMFMVGSGFDYNNSRRPDIYIYTKNGDFYCNSFENGGGSTWTQKTSPPVTPNEIAFMCAPYGACVTLLTISGEFYYYNRTGTYGSSNTWTQKTSPPVTP